jgi:beta-aspartyl-peptidase (threonine type)
MADMDPTSVYVITVHGGAGVISQETMTDADRVRYHSALREALDAGYAVLHRGGSALDAVEAAVRVMEDEPLFNAGRGSVLNGSGTVEMDACLADGRTLKSGAVTGCTTAKNPITLARVVMERTPHAFLAGAAVDAFAAAEGVECRPPEYFITERRREQWRAAIAAHRITLDHSILPSPSHSPPAPPTGKGTVGAVARDGAGHLAAATSTGGMTNKWPGRVGDTPVIGCGTYADDATAAVSCTGTGETIMSVVLAHRTAHYLEVVGPAATLDEAAAHAMARFDATGGSGGFVAVDRRGAVAMPFNTEGMYRGYRSSAVGEGAVYTEIYGPAERS